MIKLAKRHPKEVNEFWEQAQDLLWEYCKADLKNHPSDNLLKRYPRWFDRFKELPQHPPKRRSSKTGDKKPDGLYALLSYEISIEYLKDIFAIKDRVDDKELIF